MIETLETRRTTPTGPASASLVMPVPAVPETVACPECHQPAVVEWRDAVASTDGPVEHVKIRCTAGHWFLMPSESLTP